MVYHFVLLSDENDFFRREIQINSDATFFDLYKSIVKSVGYDEHEMSTFYLCDEGWNPKEEISMFERETSSDEDCYTMDKTKLDELLDEEGQQLFYCFDLLAERGFYVSLFEIIPGQSLSEAKVLMAQGDAPTQTSMPDIEDILPKKKKGGKAVDDDFDLDFDDEVDLDDIDPDGYGSIDETSFKDLY